MRYAINERNYRKLFLIFFLRGHGVFSEASTVTTVTGAVNTRYALLHHRDHQSRRILFRTRHLLDTFVT